MTRRLLLTASCLLTLGSFSLTAAPIGDLYHITGGAFHTHSQFEQLTIRQGETFTLADLKGPGKITYFYLTDDTAGKWYPGLVLRIYWDDEVRPSLELPLADFFGAIGGRAVDYQSALMQVNHACFMSYLPMPFSKRARLVLFNDGDRDYSQKVAYGIDSESDPALATESSRLHAAWRRSNPVTGGVHPIAAIQGRGQYIGGYLQAVSRAPGIWFGEGDTLFRIDGASPTAHSPGTEDEYGSCWEDPHWRTFASPYCGHPMNENGTNRMYRWYIPNPVRFQKSLEVEIQNQHQNGTPAPAAEADDYISVAFWYQDSPHPADPLPSFKTRTAPSFSR